MERDGQHGAQAGADGVRLRSRTGRAVVLATVLGSGMAQLDATVVNVALPRIGRDLDAGLTSLQWTVNAYTLTLSGLLLLGGALGDRWGRRRVFVAGVVWFTLASIACAVAPSSEVLVAARGLQGVGAALLTPGSLAIIEAVFVVEDRAPAVGTWSGLGGVASAAGPLLGGVLVGLAGWGWRLAFLVNVPLAVVTVRAARRIPETRDPASTGRLDVPGAVLAALGLAGVVFALTDGPAGGWSAGPVAAGTAGLLLLAVFVVRERRSTSPLVPPSLFASRDFTGANLATLAVYGALGGAFFLLPLQLQEVLGYGPLAAGAALLPVTAALLLLSTSAGRLATRTGPRLPMTVGPLVAAAGLLLLTRADADGRYLADVLPGVVVFGLGLALTVAPLTATVLAAAPAEQSGVASAVNNDVARTAGLLAVAVLPAAAGISGNGGADAIAAGFGRGMVLAAAGCAAGGLVSALLVGRRTGGAPGPHRA